MDTRSAVSANDESAREAEPADQPEARAPYAEPTLTRLGTVTELTEGVKAGPNNDGGGGSFQVM